MLYSTVVNCYFEEVRNVDMPILFIVSIIHSYIIIYAVELSCISVQVFTHNL